MRERIAALLLAAGLSRRMGAPKLLLPLGGKPLARICAEGLLHAGFDPVLVVTGPGDEALRAALSGLPVRLAVAQNPEAGMGASLAAGVAALGEEADAVAVALADMPALRVETLGALAAAFRAAPEGILAPRHGGRRGHPVFFDFSRYRGELLALTGDRGARELLAAHLDDLREWDVDDPGVTLDVDTPEAYRRAVAPLAHALGVERGGMAALAGAGGKTTLMCRLAREWRALGLKAAAATTTKIFPPSPDEGFLLCLGTGLEELRSRLDACGEALPVLGAALSPEGKVLGIRPEVCDALVAQGLVDALAVEADGSRCLPVKAPGPGEPVVPAGAGLFVAVVGLSCLGTPLDDAHAFRPERLAQVTGLPLGGAIGEETLARLLAAPEGLSHGAPPTARRTVVLNQADTPALAEAGRRIADAALSGPGGWERVVLARLNAEDPVVEVLER